MSAPAEEKETGRIEAFSDGVFAIAITLLVLELKVPHLEDGGRGRLADARPSLRQWPSYVALVTSFFTILVMWANHHRMFNVVRRSNARFLYANGLLLLLVTVVPFPTALLAEYFEKPGASVAAAVYARHVRPDQRGLQPPLALGDRRTAAPQGRRDRRSSSRESAEVLAGRSGLSRCAALGAFVSPVRDGRDLRRAAHRLDRRCRGKCEPAKREEAVMLPPSTGFPSSWPRSRSS